MNSLGVEFYRNYVGIDELLRVEFTHPRYKTATPEVIELNLLHLSNVMKKPELYKPYLKTVEDLTDEELMFVFGRDDLDNRSINKWSGEYIEHLSDGHLYNEFNTVLNEFKHCDQQVLNRMYSLHSHPKAKEYIENGLAVSYKDLNTGEKSE